MSKPLSGIHEVSFQANPTQRLFIENKPPELDLADPSTYGHQVVDLFSSRMGEGKSAGLVWAAQHYQYQNPGSTAVFIRDTWVNLEKTTQQEFFHWFKPGVFGRYVKSEKLWHWTVPEMQGAKIYWIGMDDEKDATKLQSMPISFFCIDEPSPAAGTGGVAEMIFTTALTRLRERSPAGGPMKWYGAKLAQNNPDESHWTYQRFVDPGTEGYTNFQTATPENTKNLPPSYYKDMAKNLGNREDLKRRFIKGTYGFQQLGKSVTPNWNDSVHLVEELEPVPGVELVLLWDFGVSTHASCCIVTQVTPLGYWLILDCLVMEEGGAYQLIEDVVKPKLTSRYEGYTWRHIGDPRGENREVSNSNQSAVKVIKAELGGKWRSGEKELRPRIDPLNAVLSNMIAGQAMVQVDKKHAKEVWHALRGGWHYKVHAGGVVGQEPTKNKASHPGDCIGYGAGSLFPLGKLQKSKLSTLRPGAGSFFGRKQFIGNKNVRLPKEAQTLP